MYPIITVILIVIQAITLIIIINYVDKAAPKAPPHDSQGIPLHLSY